MGTQIIRATRQREYVTDDLRKENREDCIIRWASVGTEIRTRKAQGEEQLEMRRGRLPLSLYA